MATRDLGGGPHPCKLGFDSTARFPGTNKTFVDKHAMYTRKTYVSVDSSLSACVTNVFLTKSGCHR